MMSNTGNFIIMYLEQIFSVSTYLTFLYIIINNNTYRYLRIYLENGYNWVQR